MPPAATNAIDRPALLSACAGTTLFWAGLDTSTVYVEIAMISLLEHNAQGATISLGQRELLLVMALIQEGRESFGCNTETGEALDTFFCSANIQVEAARRKDLKKTIMRQKIKIVTAPNIASRKGASTA